MEVKKYTLSFLGIGVGAIALMLALVHFWAGPFSPQPSLEQVVAERAVSIRDATIAALKGEAAPQAEQSRASYDLDRLVSLSTAILGGLAVILAVLGFALKEPARVAGGGALLGIVAIAFQFAAFALGLIVVVILVSVVLGNLDFG